MAKSEFELMGVVPDNLFYVVVGTGESTNFWNEAWLGTSPLSLRFPNLFKLEKRKSARISERRNSYGFAMDWKRTPSATQLRSLNLKNLRRLLTHFPSQMLRTHGVFRVNILRDQIDSVITDVSIKIMEWSSMVPIKVLVFIWRACLGRILTADALTHRGVNTNSTLCSMCSNQEETADHLLVDCMFANDTFKWISKWCGLDLPLFSTVEEVISFASQWGNCPKKRKILISIVYGIMWCIWPARNNRIFNQAPSKPSSTADHAMTLIYGWVKYRGKIENCNWVFWCNNPFSIL
uniref:Reverse transcriptase zinc-binding domain-containing protein n=1 Tax=Lactuca sativa TaxID=4236 RepID=A0A9R1W0R1_LACSA|nr:hypothetical protein LSAT_V11C300121650 [Lactuca sativa]